MNRIKTIYVKELREMLRDKRVRSSALFGPMMMVILMLLGFGTLISTLSQPSNLKIHVIQADNSFVKGLRGSKMNVLTVASLEEGKKMVEDGKARIVLDFDKDFDAKLASGQAAKVDAYYNPNEQLSEIALSAITKSFDAANRKSAAALLEAKGVSPELAQPLKLHSVEVGKAKKGSDLLVGFLPYLIVIWAFYGGMGIVSDLVAGEKEKNTLETLLITPTRRTEIALGKLLALTTICLSSVVSALAGVYVVAASHAPVIEKVFSQGVGLAPEALLTIAVVIIPTALFFASLMLAISAFARNARESQSYLALVSFVILMPAIASQFIGFTDAGSQSWVGFVPVLGTANAIRHAMFNQYDLGSIAATTLVSIVLATIATTVVVKLFNREEILVRV